MKELNEKGFVFIDGDGRPYWCRMYNDEPWFLYWHEGSKAWVKLRKVTQAEIWFANEKKINNEHAQAYHDLHEKFIN